MAYDLIVCGTGFASSFFLKGALDRRPDIQVLVLERGNRDDHGDMLAARTQSSTVSSSLYAKQGLADKDWLFTVGLGGGSNCWWGQTPRFMPDDFELKTRYDVGYDWPLSYDELEPFYGVAEALMGVAGPAQTPYPMSVPYPQPPHQLSSFDRRMIELVGPQMWIASPTARSSTGTAARGKCCANGVCGLCPVDAKFRVMNELATLYDDNPQISLQLGAEVTAIDIVGGTAKGVVWRAEGKEKRADADMVFLGANGIFNPVILENSGETHPLNGKRLNEQAGVNVTVDFANLANFDGGTHITGLGYMYYGGDQRRTRASCVIENHNAPAQIRVENGKWRNRALLKIVAENLPEDRNHVVSGDKPVTVFVGHSQYAVAGLDQVKLEFSALLGQVDAIENISFSEIQPTEGHIQGTVVMGTDAENSIVDSHLVHHKVRNLVVGGSSCFPSGPPANPSLTVAALSLRSAGKLFA